MRSPPCTLGAAAAAAVVVVVEIVVGVVVFWLLEQGLWDCKLEVQTP